MLCIIASMKMYTCVYLPTFCMKNKELVRSNVSSTTLLLSLHCSANITVPLTLMASQLPCMPTTPSVGSFGEQVTNRINFCMHHSTLQ